MNKQSKIIRYFNNLSEQGKAHAFVYCMMYGSEDLIKQADEFERQYNKIMGD